MPKVYRGNGEGADMLLNPHLQILRTRTTCLRFASLVALILVEACSAQEAPASLGNVAQGKVLIGRFGCGSCHEIPGVQQADGLVGPPLIHMASRTYIAGVLRNTPENLSFWVRYPQKVVPGNAMPNSALSPAQAQDVVAYLYTLK